MALPLTLAEAAKKAAVADRVTSVPDEDEEAAEEKPKRRGKWLPEEEAYATRLIREFKDGLLPLSDGTTLRTFLATLLNCDPMRISKKFVGANCIGKQVFRKRAIEHTNRTQAEIDQRRYELTQLETTFLNKMYEQVAKVESSNSSCAATNKSAAAAGRAMLQARNKSNIEGGGKLGLFAQLQSSGGGMIDNSLAGDYLKKMTEAQQTGHYPSSYAPLGVGQPTAHSSALSLSGFTNFLQPDLLSSGLSAAHLPHLAGSNNIASSASLAALLGKQRSFERLMSLDFQSMQSIDNLASVMQAGMRKQQALNQSGMKNVDWGNQVQQVRNTQNDSSSGSSMLSKPQGASKPILSDLLRSLHGNSDNGSAKKGAENVSDTAPNTDAAKVTDESDAKETPVATDSTLSILAEKISGTSGDGKADKKKVEDLVRSLSSNLTNGNGGSLQTTSQANASFDAYQPVNSLLSNINQQQNQQMANPANQFLGLMQQQGMGQTLGQQIYQNSVGLYNNYPANIGMMHGQHNPLMLQQPMVSYQSQGGIQPVVNQGLYNQPQLFHQGAGLNQQLNLLHHQQQVQQQVQQQQAALLQSTNVASVESSRQSAVSASADNTTAALMQSMSEGKEGGSAQAPAFADEHGSDASILGVKRGAEEITGDALDEPSSKKQLSTEV